MLFPTPPRPGDTVALISPSSPLGAGRPVEAMAALSLA